MKIRLKRVTIFIFLFTSFTNVSGVSRQLKPWTCTNGNYRFEWNIADDKALVFKISTHDTIWKGSLLPAFRLQDTDNREVYIKAVVTGEKTEGNLTRLELRFGNLGNGSLVIKEESWGISIPDFEVKWTREIPKILDLYIGTSAVPSGRQSLMDDQNPPFSSDWSAFGYCIPGAKEGTVQSFFRMWDFGQTNIALGSFGPSMGIPYGAAFPRPVLSLAMGDDNGWMVIGAGSVPDAPMTLKMRSSLGCLDFLYREDLWGEGSQVRDWSNPLRIVFGETAWEAYKQYFNSFPQKEPVSSLHQKAIWNTWGNWRNKDFPIRPMVDFAKKIGAEIFVIDDPWEASQGLGKADTVKFPDIYDDWDYILRNKMMHGLWECVGWIGDTAACGLTKSDLICDSRGNPCIASWNFNPFEPGYFCIDISSQHARDFLKERTIRTMMTMHPQLIKLDFGYGMPNPNLGVPRDPGLRGERYSLALLKLIAGAARSVDPDVTIMYYGIHPLFLSPADLVSLDDQGDMWYATKEGHSQWSIWAALLSDRHVAISGSSSYDWYTDDEIILNTFILGSPGAVLGTHLDDGSPVPERYLNRRLAVNKWYRKTIDWQPVWLNSRTGNMILPPQLNCWGRAEGTPGKYKMTALILRGKPDKSVKELDSFEWDGRWALISQDDEGIGETRQLAVVPFDTGFISIRLSSMPDKIEKVNIHGSLPLQKREWKDGILTLRVDDNDLNQTAGFIIHLKN